MASHLDYFFDYEFMENGPDHPLVPISLGLVCEDGRELYAIYTDANLTQANSWVEENVIPYLRSVPERIGLSIIEGSRLEIGTALIDFIGIPNRATTTQPPWFWGYFCSYDWVLFAQTFGRMIDLPRGWPMHPMDIKQLANELGNPTLPPQSGIEHVAIEDARWNQEALAFLRGYKKGLQL